MPALAQSGTRFQYLTTTSITRDTSDAFPIGSVRIGGTAEPHACDDSPERA